MRKPRLFIASSVESLAIAEAVNVNLDHEFEVTIWKNGTFKLSSNTIDDLVEKSSFVDFALFIFAPDDIATIRSRREHVVRDNVLFEMGLFIGAIGKERSFILKPRNEEMHLPTDLLGTTPADYDAERSDNDLVSATNRACSLIKSEVQRIGIIDHVIPKNSNSKRIAANAADYKLFKIDLQFLAACLQTHTCNPDGLSFHSITHNMGYGGYGQEKKDDSLLQVAAVKLERMGLIAKTVEEDYQHGEGSFYSYSITESGIDTLLKNEELLHSNNPTQETKKFGGKAPFNND